MSYGYSLRLAQVNKKASARSLGVKLGRTCIKRSVPVSQVAYDLGVSRQTVYNWFTGVNKPSKQTAEEISELIVLYQRDYQR
mgnify:CR=1 FL=1|jgi:DNA-binding XRE family transcriptional regulator